ncbi:MAG: aspartate aminotransferase, partial [Desulfobacteraceae bacterium]|nr:aspartate aminotransferase [Desulfobacteraceae bacterium]
MKIEKFKLERFFAKHEFKAKHLLCCSDCEGLSIPELLDLADENSIKMWQDLHLGYTEAAGHPALRQEVSLLYEDIYPSEVLIA